MRNLTRPRQINIAAMLVASAAILVIFAAAPDLFPTIPPGPFILVAAAGIVAFAPGRWTPAVGVITPLLILLGGIVSGGLADNLDENAAAIAGTAAQVLALSAAIAFGVLATRIQARCTRSQTPA